MAPRVSPEIFKISYLYPHWGGGEGRNNQNYIYITKKNKKEKRMAGKNRKKPKLIQLYFIYMVSHHDQEKKMKPKYYL